MPVPVYEQKPNNKGAAPPPPNPARFAVSAKDRQNRDEVLLCCDCKYSKDLQNPVRGYQPKAPFKCVNLDCYRDRKPQFDYFHGERHNFEYVSCHEMRTQGACGEAGRYYDSSVWHRLASFARRLMCGIATS